MTAILKDFEEDEQNGVWQWFGVTSDLLEKARKAVLDLPSTVFVRSGDALHLACAEEHGFQEVYTNDRHMLQAAKHFHLTGAVNVLTESTFSPERRSAPRASAQRATSIVRAPDPDLRTTLTLAPLLISTTIHALEVLT